MLNEKITPVYETDRPAVKVLKDHLVSLKIHKGQEFVSVSVDGKSKRIDMQKNHCYVAALNKANAAKKILKLLTSCRSCP